MYFDDFFYLQSNIMPTKVLDRITIYETKADHLIDLTKTAIIIYD